ncbi:MAG: polyprenol monophosphomannose synthase [Candidatus Aenigmarchaeota archaeon]|nr:polyprenol monophosphomannose synthase [Candidatus Aenigmarchaeota archaeon]
MKTAAVLPTYNEIENIENLIAKIPFQIDLIAVDDSSPDGTGRLLEGLRRRYGGRLRVIHRRQKLGLGTAYIAGFRKAIHLGYDFIFTMDADLSHDPECMEEMLKMARSKCGLVIGSRYVKGGGTSWNYLRSLISRSANAFALALLRMPVHDCTSGYRCYRKEVLENIGFGSISSTGYSFLLEILFICHKKGFSIREVPIFFSDRREGKSKLGKAEMAKFLLALFRLTMGNLFSHKTIRVR